MKHILLLLVFTLFLSTQVRSQEQVDSTLTKLSERVFNYTLGYFDDLRTVVYLYRTKLTEEPENHEAILKFVNDYNLNYGESPIDTIQYLSNADGSYEISFSLNSDSQLEHRLQDSLLIRHVAGIMKVGAPLSKGSSITSVYGKLTSGKIEYVSGEQIALPQFKSGILMARVDIKTAMRISNAK